jgi:hypothetical protein
VIDLASIDDPDPAPGTLASVLGLAPCTENQLPYLAAAVWGKRALLVVDKASERGCRRFDEGSVARRVGRPDPDDQPRTNAR